MPAAGAQAAQSAPLDELKLRELAGGPGRLWTDFQVLAETVSTNADAITAARAGASEGLVVAAEWQIAGRGRLGRTWYSRPGTALTFSVLLRPAEMPPPVRGWLPLLAGVATATAVRTTTGLQACLKWPNDVLVEGAKLAGILAEQSGDAVVVGIGLNVLGLEPDLPVLTATTLQLHGADRTDRTDLLASVLAEIERWYRDWRATAGGAEACGLLAEYLRLSATVGRNVRVQLPGGHVVTGLAQDVDASGRLIVQPWDGESVVVSAGDVIHVR